MVGGLVKQMKGSHYVNNFSVKCQGQSGETDFYTIQPDDVTPLIFKYVFMENKDVRFTSIASAFKNRELLQSKVLTLAWRVTYSAHDLDPWTLDWG